MEYILAAMLLMAPPDDEAHCPDVKLYPVVRFPLQVLAIEMQILDPREVRYVLTSVEEYPSDLNLLRRRATELKDAPPAEDCYRFPERTTVNEFLAFNRVYRQNLDFNTTPSNWWATRVAIQETDRLYEVWDTVRDANCQYYYVTVRRQALMKLRDMLGEEAYYAGRLPPYVPTWRFGVIRK